MLGPQPVRGAGGERADRCGPHRTAGRRAVVRAAGRRRATSCDGFGPARRGRVERPAPAHLDQATLGYGESRSTFVGHRAPLTELRSCRPDESARVATRRGALSL
jgi:hypothetical protein